MFVHDLDAFHLSFVHSLGVSVHDLTVSVHDLTVSVHDLSVSA